MARRRRWSGPSTIVAFVVGLVAGHLIFDVERESCSRRWDPSADVTLTPPPSPFSRVLFSREEPVLLADELEKNDPLRRLNNATTRLLFAGVMTARKYLTTRAAAVYRTWGRNVPGKIVFFSSEGSTAPKNQPDLPLVALPDVDDSYPPQKKSFLMLKHMWDKYGGSFEWFLRADDDVYIRTDKLESFLRSVDSNRPLFIGQAGRGNQNEFGLLSLEYDENFCMGGPGVIMSRFTLAKVAENVEYCLNNLYTTHEDVELGRCVQKFAGIPCTWSYEMQTIFYHNGSGAAAFTGSLKKKEVHRAITLHPVKDSNTMYKLHNYIKMLRVKEKKFYKIQLHRDILAMSEQLKDDTLLNGEELINVTLFGKAPGLTKYRNKNSSDILNWDFVQRSIYSLSKINPRMKIGSSLQEGLEDVIREVMDIINMYSKQRGRVIDFKEILYGYTRHDPLHGVDYILDMLLVYKKYRGRKMTVPVRRHAYLQQQYASINVREIDHDLRIEDHPSESSSFASGMKQVIGKGITQIRKNFPILLFSPKAEIFTQTDAYTNPINFKVINFILPLAGRFKTFRRFVQNFETLCLKNNEKVSLTVILFPSDRENTLQRITDTIKGLQKLYPDVKIQYISMYEDFSRARALSVGAAHFETDDLLFFVDVDIAFGSEALWRIRQHTVKGKSMYYPVVFSQFDPQGVHGSLISPNHFTISERAGYWRQYGYGICSLYKSDLERVGGVNTSIVGWGKEDVDLFEKVVKSTQHGNVDLFRAPDPDLIHIFHPVTCQSQLGHEQMAMCRATRADSYGSVGLLEERLRTKTPTPR